MDKRRFDHIIKSLDFDELNDWEEKFVLSVSEQFEKKSSLSHRQEEILEKILTDQQIRELGIEY